ncbi:MAG: CoA-binding protein [Solirubrobacterales bacterium]|nr:CoA-binding protein [Solirubrobacterales bacterium]
MSREAVQTARGEWTPPSAIERRNLLRRARTIAVVGASGNPARASYFVLTYLRSSSARFEIWPVNPKGGEVLGLPTYPSLGDVPATPDIVVAFRRAVDLPEVAEQAVEADAGAFWAQLGLHSDAAVRTAYEAGLQVVTNRCVKIEHARFQGGLHLAGFNTGVISSKRTRG